MLVLTRRTGESIVIGNDIVVTVLEVRHDQVRIGIDAPRSVQVHREEVFAQVMQENAAAVASAADLANPLLRRPAAPLPGGAPARKGPRLQQPPPAARSARPQATPVRPPGDETPQPAPGADEPAGPRPDDDGDAPSPGQG